MLEGILNEPVSDLDVAVISKEDLQGALEEVGKLPANDPLKNKFINRVQRGFKSIPKREMATSDLTAKAEFERRIDMLPANIQQELKNNRLQIVDGNIYSIKSISEKTNVELMENKDDKTVGLTNVNGRKLDANQHFLVTGVILNYAVAAGTTPEQIKVADYKEDLPAIIKNGEFTMELDTEVLIPEISCEVFNTKSRTDIPLGYYRLSNPKWLKPQTEIKPEIKMSGVAVLNAAVKFQLVGATIAKK